MAATASSVAWVPFREPDLPGVSSLSPGRPVTFHLMERRCVLRCWSFWRLPRQRRCRWLARGGGGIGIGAVNHQLVQLSARP